MNIGRASVHPVEDPPATEGANEPRARMKDIQGMPATLGGIALRLFQFIFAASALCIMATTSDFPSVTAFSYLVAATGLQSIWSFSMALTDIYAVLVRRSLQNQRVLTLFTVGDGVTSTLTFAAASASAGITVLIDNDLTSCSQNHCIQFESATAMAYISWFICLPSFFFNFWFLASQC